MSRKGVGRFFQAKMAANRSCRTVTMTGASQRGWGVRGATELRGAAASSGTQQGCNAGISSLGIKFFSGSPWIKV